MSILLKRYFRYTPLITESRLDELLLFHFREPEDFSKLYQGFQLKFSNDHQWVRFSQGKFYMGFTYFILDLLKQVNGAQYSLKQKALRHEEIAVVKSKEYDLSMTAPFKMWGLQYNQKLSWDFRWLNVQCQQIWLVRGEFKESDAQSLLAQSEYRQTGKVLRW